MRNIKEILFQNNCFGQTAFEEHDLNSLVRSRKTTSVFSKYTVGGMNKSTNVLCSPLAKAVVRYLTDKNCGVGKHGDFYVSMLKTATISQFCVYNAKLGEIKHLVSCPLIEVDKKSMLYDKYSMATDRRTLGYGWETHTGEVIWLALLPQLFEDEEIKKQLSVLKTALKSPDAQGGFIPQEGEDALFVISDNIYRRIKHAYCTADTPTVTVEIPEFDDESLLIKTVDELLSYAPQKVYAGDFKELGIGNKNGTPIYTVEELPKQFSLVNPKLLTKEQEERIPKLESWYVIPDYLIQSLIAIKTFHNAESKFQNILLSGRAGSGKSKAAQALAYATNLPFYPINCNPNTDEMQLTGGFSPNVEKGENSVLERPSLEEIELDPETAYRRMTGESKEVTSEEVLNYLKRSERNQADFIVTNTPLVEAVRNGGVIELQEISLIKDPGMLGMLNSLMTIKKLFTSSEYLAGLNAILQSSTTNLSIPCSLIMEWGKKDDFVAYTDGAETHINGNNSLSSSFKNLPYRSLSIKGLLAHELGHILFSNFQLLREYNESFMAGKIYGEDNISHPNLEKIKDVMQKNPLARNVIAQFACNINNLLEDIYIESKMVLKFPGTLKSGIICNNERLGATSLSIDKQLSLPNAKSLEKA